MFEIEGKVALITGAASGLGFSHAKELLKNGLKGVTLTDVDEINGEKALEQIESEFGKDKAIFVKTDVTKYEEFEDAFKKTVEKFKNVDILINNAGIMNDAIWEKEIAINVNGSINGILLGMENYLKNYRQGDESVILNTSSVDGVTGDPKVPIYGATKFAVVGMTICWGSSFHYDRTKVRVVSICPGRTDTQLFAPSKYTIAPDYLEAAKLLPQRKQRPEFVSEEMVKILRYAENGSLWVIDADEPAYKFVQPNRNIYKSNILKVDNQ